jgi:hypothetical protein
MISEDIMKGQLTLAEDKLRRHSQKGIFLYVKLVAMKVRLVLKRSW